ncbi:MAG: protein translocase subunit SecD [Planctomycetota bacterium]|jgi:SecD/SecF fusion protein|nr:protein translocase subunit SecD [Planctomycetota bacterium]
MIDNARRQVLLVALVLATAIALISTMWPPPLGLDLSGGSRLIYFVDIEAAKENEQVPDDADPEQIMLQTVAIIHERVDPTGTREAVVTRRGDRDILIELPKLRPAELDSVVRAVETLGRLELRMAADDDYNNDGVKFDMSEESKRLTEWLDAEGEDRRELLTEDPEKVLLFNLLPQDAGGPAAGQQNLKWFPHRVKPRLDQPEAWDYAFSSNSGSNAVAISSQERFSGKPSGPDDYLVEMLPINMSERYFRGEDMDPSAVGQTLDEYGQPAVAYRIRNSRASDYADWSEEYIGKSSAIILNGYVRSAPVFQGRIYGDARITGQFTQTEVDELIKVLRTGSLQVKPTQKSKISIGASLGADSIKKGFLSIVFGGSVVLLFILAYYRLAGIVAFLAILMNITLILGSVVFIQATLTLPGLGGLVLTMGMAIDANILIYERIREEKRRGKDLLQAAKLGFERAMVTILDANITTFLAAVVLYNVGTGPIRGFAVTLMIGILTSLFTAFFVSRLIFHYMVDRKIMTDFKAAGWLTNSNFNFLRGAKIAGALSVIVIAAGIANFTQVPNAIKYGLDFTGGADLKVVFKEAKSPEELRERLRASAGFKTDFPNPVVNTAGAADGGRAREFSVKLKLSDDLRARYEAAETKHKQESDAVFEKPYKQQIMVALEDWLVPGAFEETKFSPHPSGTSDIAGTNIHFIEPVKIADVVTLIKASRGESASAVPSKGDPEAETGRDLLVEFQVAKGTPKETVTEWISKALDGNPKRGLEPLKDTAGNAMLLSNPIPEAEEIGSRMVGELRTAAIGAMVLALFLIVMYIRVRFHEYKYGLGAVAALIHDVFVALGIVTLCNQLGFVNAEIDLPMIAAFLTIIGYSINDTIVIFDRIRENVGDQQRLGDTKESFGDIINRSINQTLSRTILTSGTTLFVVIAQLVVNHGSGSSLEGFSFALIVGVLTGTYSTIFVASPIVLWLRNREISGGAPDATTESGGKITIGSGV